MRSDVACPLRWSNLSTVIRKRQSHQKEGVPVRFPPNGRAGVVIVCSSLSSPRR